MTAMSQYLAEARMSELRESRGPGRHRVARNFMAEAAQVLKGALQPTAGAGASLGRGLQRDLGLR